MEAQVITIIPARSGSKGMKDKNIRLLAGIPLMAHSIKQSLVCGLRTVVSTDSEEYAKIAREFGAEVVMRQKEISQDDSLDIEWADHACRILGLTKGLIVHLRPCCPIRQIKHIKQGVALLQHSMADSLRSVEVALQTPYKMYVHRLKLIRPIMDSGCNMPRQKLPVAYYHNGYLDIVKVMTILNGSMTGEKILPFYVHNPIDIDTENDFVEAERLIHDSHDL